MRIEPADLDAPDVQALLAEHLEQMHAASPACSVHALPLASLRAPHVRTWTARDNGDTLLGIGALAQLDPSHGELKSMRTAAHAQGRGVGSAVLAHLLDEARARGYVRVSLETGTQQPFAAAHRLYERHGFHESPPFGDYVLDSHSRFYTRALAAPEASNPARMTWSDVPAGVVAAIEERAGARVVAATGTSTGFSPGFAGRVAFDSGEELFIKLISATRDPWSVDLVRGEAVAARMLPSAAPAPPLLWSLDDGDWVVLALEVVDGREPDLVGSPADRRAVFDALEALAQVRVPEDSGLPPLAQSAGIALHSWARLADQANSPDVEPMLERLGSLRPWVERHLGALVELEAQAPDHTEGDRLIHGDMRADNMLVGRDRVWLVDWPYAAAGAPWFDLAALMPAMSMAGAGPAHRIFHSHPLAASVTVEAERAVVAALAGFFAVSSAEPEVPALPGLRRFQRAQALPAVDWLRQITPGLV